MEGAGGEMGGAAFVECRDGGDGTGDVGMEEHLVEGEGGDAEAFGDGERGLCGVEVEFEEVVEAGIVGGVIGVHGG